MANNKIAIVTGGNRGLGKSMAMHLAMQNVHVIITYNTNEAEANATVAEIENTGASALALQLNIGNIASLANFAQTVSTTLQQKWNATHFDFLINNAGIGATIPFMQATEEQFDNFMNVHFKGVYFLTQKLVPLMNDGGRIINISSGTTRFCNPGYSIYASMKSAIETFSRYLAKELSEKRIAVNVVAPGAIETDFNNAFVRNNPQVKSMIAANTAMGRTGVPEDIGGIVAFLCSPEAGWINAQRIEATGGVWL
jgi:NAD(P)-dependent dehydrogenase (short-subunit alcohol dehydrogenase family)